MNRWNKNYQGMVTILALVVAGFFLVFPAAAAGPENYQIEFWADRTQIRPGECVNIYWNTNNVQTVYYNNQPVSGIAQTRVECPATSTAYNLLVTNRNNQQILRQVYVAVAGQPNYNNWNPNTMRIEFWADRTQVRAGECLNIYWDTNNVQTVHYNNEPVSGIQQNRVECPARSTTYNLLVRTRHNQDVLKQIYVEVIGRPFDRDQLRMENGQMIDVDRQGHVSAVEDDFRWTWLGGERGALVKADDDDDLRLALVSQGGSSRFDRLSEEDCRDRLSDHDSTQVEVGQDTIGCFRTDDGRLGKFRVDDIGRNEGWLVLDWGFWD